MIWASETVEQDKYTPNSISAHKQTRVSLFRLKRALLTTGPGFAMLMSLQEYVGLGVFIDFCFKKYPRNRYKNVPVPMRCKRLPSLQFARLPGKLKGERLGY